MEDQTIIKFKPQKEDMIKQILDWVPEITITCKQKKINLNIKGTIEYNFSDYEITLTLTQS